jgi:hypothetical protein
VGGEIKKEFKVVGGEVKEEFEGNMGIKRPWSKVATNVCA